MPAPDDAYWYLEQAMQKANELPAEDQRSFARELENLASELHFSADSAEPSDSDE